MKEEYKTCPYCNNMVDKKDKQCPYCLKSLSRRNITNTETNYERINNEENIDRDSGIKDNKSGNNFEIPPLFQKMLNFQQAQKTWDKETRKKTIKYIVIFYIVIQIISLIIALLWE